MIVSKGHVGTRRGVVRSIALAVAAVAGPYLAVLAADEWLDSAWLTTAAEHLAEARVIAGLLVLAVASGVTAHAVRGWNGQVITDRLRSIAVGAVLVGYATALCLFVLAWISGYQMYAY